VTQSPYFIDYRGRFSLDAPPERVWQIIEHSEHFESWWGWLEDFRLEGDGLEDGTVLWGTVAPPVPYRMRLAVRLDRCERPHRIEATVHGDLEGRAVLELAPEADATIAEVEWRIEMMQSSMRIAARVARPLLSWGHDRVVSMTVASFRRQLRRLDAQRQIEGRLPG